MPRPYYAHSTSSKEYFAALKEANKPLWSKINKKDYSFKDVIQKINMTINEYLMTTGNFIDLPFGFGMLGYTKYKEKIKSKDGQILLAVNWAETKKQGKYVYIDNSHTNFHKIALYLNNIYSPNAFARYYKFKSVFYNNVLLNSYLRSPENTHKETIYMENPKIILEKKFKENKERKRNEKANL